ncbi:DUF305 domain-containing protein [Herbidospora mongoliensis]|uniref:DUF305 domain-containing protein n=1 Tax=Herbidospora mongoliensis TaxID=688067 RepID=UPI0014711B41|nr:DUF305 domain-containing protein [Herbidospora mongoliensis]
MSALLLVTGLVLAGCSEEPPPAPNAPVVIQPGAPGQAGKTLSGSAVPSATAAPFTADDVIFFQGMIPHHAQALRLTALVPARTENRDVTLIAERIASTQEDEIAQMRRWLTSRGQDVPSTEHGHGAGGLMPGMLTEEQFTRLEKTKGADFDRLFTQFMIGHHMGALEMVGKLFGSGGGQETETYVFATHVDADQRIEIDRMQQLLAAMGGPLH